MARKHTFGLRGVWKKRALRSLQTFSNDSSQSASLDLPLSLSGSLLKRQRSGGGGDDGGSAPDVSQTSEHYDFMRAEAETDIVSFPFTSYQITTCTEPQVYENI